jgi:PAS domain S-box-containing protein
MKIRTQLIAGMLVFGVLLMIISALVITTNYQVEHLIDQGEIADSIALGVGELEYLSNDYILYREPQQIERWQTKYTSVSDFIASLVVEQPDQRAIISTLEASLENTRLVFDDITSSPIPAEGIPDTRFIQLSWSRMAVQNQGMVFDAGRLANLLRIEAEELRQTRTWLIFALTGVFVAFLFTSYALFYRRTLRSIEHLQEGARIIGSGNLGHTIEEKGDDEISDLSRSFNRMTSDLKQVTASKSELEEEIAYRKRVEDALQQRTEDLAVSEEELRNHNEELTAAQEELRIANLELIRRESLLRSLFDSPGMMRGIVEVVTDDDVRHISDNVVTARYMGLTPEALQNKLGSELGELPDNLRLWIRHYRESERAGQPVHFEYVDKRGEHETWLLATVNYLGKNEDAESRFAYVAQDITERKRAEEALRELTTRYELVIAGANAAIWDWDIPNKTVVFSPQWKALRGYDGPEISNREEEWSNGIHPDDAPGVFAAIEAHFKGKTPVFAMEYRVRCKDGSWKWIFDRGIAHRNQAGQVIRMAGSEEDITDRKKAEEQIQEYVESLKRSNEDLERFAYIASHDLQEPLRNVVSFSQLLSRRYGEKLDPAADEYIGFIVEGGKRMQTLVQDLLEYSRVNTKGRAFEAVKCEDIVEHIIRNLQMQIQESDAVVRTDPLPTVLADPSQLVLVFQNLIGNAIKFRKDGVQPRIRISASRMEDRWKLSVSDNGIGIDPAFFDKIFVIFQRLHTRDKYPGTGVGLAIVKKIIERHGGQIWVESEVGKGSTFFFTLPDASKNKSETLKP